MNDKIIEDSNLGGSIAIQSSSLALGYYPNAWAEIYKLENKFETDDLAYFDNQDYLYITGRQSLIIITGGEKVFPPEVEAVILETKLVQDICVLGLPDRYWGEVVAAIYVPVNLEINSGTNQEAIAPQLTQYLTQHLTQHLAKYKHPKLWFSVEKLPRNPQGKINYQALRKTLSTSI